MKKTDLEINREQRLEFVKFWADYIKTHPDRDWSAQQALLINSQISSSRQLMTTEMFLKMKERK
ncbi:hypothetical protein HYX10_06625 [Candidatus Woesearchaeota archaeon]|nr:hypothetical protein [Candidatus Woesearchaeota archaeon]